MKYTRRVVPCAALLMAGLVGCQSTSHDSKHDHGTTTRPAVATDVDPSHADPEYWLAQKPVRSVGDVKFDVLWDAAERVSQDYLFQIDRRDQRNGVLTTVPMVSAQWFEPWRRELQSTDDVAQSSVATIRRSIRWSFRKVSNGWAVSPRVLIERQALTEQRVSGALSRAYFRRDATDGTFGNRETDQNIRLPDTYFYPVGRDFEFEDRLTDKMLKQLRERNEVAMR